MYACKLLSLLVKKKKKKKRKSSPSYYKCIYVFIMYVKQNQEEKGNENGSFIFINLAFVILSYYF